MCLLWHWHRDCVKSTRGLAHVRAHIRDCHEVHFAFHAPKVDFKHSLCQNVAG